MVSDSCCSLACLLVKVKHVGRVRCDIHLFRHPPVGWGCIHDISQIQCPLHVTEKNVADHFSTSSPNDGPGAPTLEAVTDVSTERSAAVAATSSISCHGSTTMDTAPTPMSAMRACANVRTARSPVAFQNAVEYMSRLPGHVALAGVVGADREQGLQRSRLLLEAQLVHLGEVSGQRSG